MEDWTEKYRPKNLNEIIGNERAVKELIKWANEWNCGKPSKRAVILSGNPGTGKTSSAIALANDYKWPIIELNTSDARNALKINNIATIGAVNETFDDNGNFVSSNIGGRKLIILDEADNLYEKIKGKKVNDLSDKGGKKAIIDTIRITMQPIILIFQQDGSVKSVSLDLNDQELLELKNFISKLIDNLKVSKDSSEFEKVIESTIIQGGSFRFKHPIISWILDFISSYKLPRSRSYIISQGHEYKINPLRNTKVYTYIPLNFWHYSDRWGFDLPDKTLVFKPSPFNIEFLHGRQIGMMTHFFGIYIFISQPYPQKCWTFFMGSARHVLGVDFTLSPFM